MNPLSTIVRVGTRLYGAHRKLFLFYFLLVALVLARGFNDGFIGDEAGYVTQNTQDMAAHPLIPFVLRGVDTGHPMLYAYPVAVLWRLFGQSNAVANVSIWIWAAIALVALHRLMEAILDENGKNGNDGKNGNNPGRRRFFWGAAAALALYCTPQFLSLAGQFLDPMPYLALLLLMLLAWVHGRRAALAMLACLVSMTRITSCLSVLGLGLFDLAYTWFVLRRRSWRALGAALAPYAFAAAAFGGYLLVKLAFLGLPLSNIPGHHFNLADLTTMWRNTRHVLAGALSLPSYSFKPLLAVAAAAFLIDRLRRPRRAPSALLPSGAPPAAAAIYAAGIAALLPSTLFFCVYTLYPQPRWMLPWHAFFILVGIHGLRRLAGRRSWLALLLLVPWCALQVTRWHAGWVPKVFSFAPAAMWRPLCVDPAFCLDVMDRKEISHQAARWIQDHRPADTALVCAYSTQLCFTDRTSGFMPPQRDVYLASMIRQGDSEAKFQWILDHYPATYVVQASWDVPEERLQLDRLMRDKPFRILERFRASSGEWIRISYYQK